MRLSKAMTRRTFLRTTGAVAAGTAVLTAKNYARAAGANDRINIGVIGLGTIGTDGHLPALLSIREADNIDIVAVCDVYETRAKQYQEKLKAAGVNASIAKDYHELLADKNIHKVVIATPEHWHHTMILDALAAQKHVYSEKPLTHNIKESLEVVEKAKHSTMQLQVGVQGMSDDSYSSAHEAIVAGKLGPVIEAQIDYVRNYKKELGPWRIANRIDNKPDDLDWDMWLGPAKKRKWEAGRYFEWRCYRDYSGGIATDLFVHRLTRIIKACGLTFPERVVGMGGVYLWDDGREMPDNFEMMAEYPEVKDVTPGMTVRILGTMANEHGAEHCIRGHKATLVFKKEGGWDIIDEASKKVVETHKKTGGEDQALHHKNHHAAIRSGGPLNCPAELGLYGVVPVCMANESYFERKMLAWDAKKQKVVKA